LIKNINTKEILHPCPECGKHHSINEWNTSTISYYEDKNIIPMEHSDLENIYVCPSCKCESTREEIDNLANRLFICPKCSSEDNLLNWDMATSKDFGQPIQGLFKAPGDHYYTCAKCNGVSTAEEIRLVSTVIA
jgi:Zn finger protein HypA/HybF involved in hydrogenase expression